MKQHEKQIEELTADDLEQVVGGASSGTTSATAAPTAPVPTTITPAPVSGRLKGSGGMLGG